MASNIEIRASKAPSVSKGDVLSALRGIGRDQLSEASPVTAQCPEVAVATRPESVALRVEGHPGEWSQESQATLTRTLAGVDGVDAQSVEVTSGGYDPDGDAQADADESPDVETIDGVGPKTAETLRAAGITTVDDVIDVGADGLVEAGIPEGHAENIVESA